MNTMMAEIRELGRIPRLHGAELSLAERLRNAKRRGHLSESQLVELAELPGPASREQGAACRMETLMSGIRELGRLPRFTDHDRAESQLAHRVRDMKRGRGFSESQLAELAEMPSYDARRRPRLDR